jgi:hypothetical protein
MANNKSSKSKEVKIYRRSDTGQFTTPEYVKKHPQTTTTETRKRKS